MARQGKAGHGRARHGTAFLTWNGGNIKNENIQM